jgi:branched-chain amino acid transport system permease protein
MTRFGKVGAGVFAVLVVLAVPYLGFSEFVLHNLVLIMLYVGLASAWNIPAYGGQLSLGHAAFFGLGAYASTLLFLHKDLSPWFGMLAAIGVALVAALLMSVPLLRLRGPFFTLATLAMVEVIHRLAIYLRSLTRGSEGLTIPFKTGWAYLSFTSRAPYYYLALGLATITVLASWLIRRSRLGYHLRAAAVDEEAVTALGVKLVRLQVAALLVSAALTSLFGVFFAQYVYVIDPDTVFSSTQFSIQPALAGIIGGMGTVAGPVIGAVLLTPLGELLRSSLSGSQQGLSFLIYGLVLIAVVRLLPGGIVSGARNVSGRLVRRRQSGQPASGPARSVGVGIGKEDA